MSRQATHYRWLAVAFTITLGSMGVQAHGQRQPGCETPCAAPAPKVIVEMSPPEVEFVNNSAACNLCRKPGCFLSRLGGRCCGGPCEIPPAAAPASYASQTMTTYYWYAPQPFMSAPMMGYAPMAAMPAMAPVYQPGFAAVPAQPAMAAMAPAAFSAPANLCNQAAAASVNPVAALAAQRAYVEAELKSRLGAMLDEQRSLSNQYNALLGVTNSGSSLSPQSGLTPRPGADLTAEFQDLQQQVRDIQKLLLRHEEYMKLLRKQGTTLPLPKLNNEKE